MGMTKAAVGTLILVFTLGTGVGCGATEPQPETAIDAQDDSTRIPEILESLQLSAYQQQQLRALGRELKRQLEPMKDAGREYLLAIAKTASRCNNNTMALDDAASWAVGVGQQVRGPVLDAIDRLHRILTPAQRKMLARRLLDGEKESKKRRKTDEQSYSVSADLDLSLSQTLTLLIRARSLKSALEERLEPWRKSLKNALVAFPRDDFSVREYRIAEVPAVVLATRFVRDAVRTLLPILDQEQCKAVDASIRDALAKAEKKSG